MRKALIVLVNLLIFNFTCHSQEQELTEASYKLEFLRADYNESKKSNEIVLYFKYIPKKGNKTLISGRLTYSLGEDGIEKTEILEKSKHGITVYGNDIGYKKSSAYKLLKDIVDFNSEEEFFILEFRLRNITEKYVEKMTFTYGLWEPSDSSIRFEKKFFIDVQK